MTKWLNAASGTGVGELEDAPAELCDPADWLPELEEDEDDNELDGVVELRLVAFDADKPLPLAVAEIEDKFPVLFDRGLGEVVGESAEPDFGTSVATLVVVLAELRPETLCVVVDAPEELCR